jgi:O-antigen/teichoic acid export membrane protein
MVDHEHRMAKGTFYLMIAQVIFLGSGYVIHVGVARMVSAEDYGRFGVILSLLMITQIFLSMGIPETVAKFISEGRDTKIVRRKALKLQFFLSMLFFFGLFLIAPALAELLNDPQLTNYIRFVSFILPIRAIYHMHRGILNGYRDFGKSALVGVINSIAKVSIVFIFLFMALEIYGAIGGYIAAALITLGFAYFFSRKNISGKKVTSKEIISFSIPMVLFAISYVGIMNLDILFVKALVENQNQVGYYTAARAISSIVFGVSMALSTTLLPSISKSFSKGDMKQTTGYINDSIRYLLIILIPLGVMVSLTSEKLLNFFFPTEYIGASTALSILIFGIAFLIFFVVLGAIVNGAGKPKLSMSIGLFLVIIACILNYFLVKNYGMMGGAMTTLFVGIVGTCILSIFVIQIFRTLIPVKSFVKIVMAGMVLIPSFFVLKNLIYGLFVLDFIIVYIVLFGVYIALLFGMNELSKNEFYYVKHLLLEWNK